LKRLGIADDDGKLAPDARRLLSPYPEGGQSAAGALRTNERRTNGANGYEATA
jgi:hypothetical protein